MNGEWAVQRQALASPDPLLATSPPTYEAWLEDANDEPCPRYAHDEERDESYDCIGVEHGSWIRIAFGFGQREMRVRIDSVTQRREMCDLLQEI